VAKRRPAGLYGAERPGAAPSRAFLLLACSLLIIAASCMCTQAKMQHDETGMVQEWPTSNDGAERPARACSQVPDHLIKVFILRALRSAAPWPEE
jgi:hypothetical protein